MLIHTPKDLAMYVTTLRKKQKLSQATVADLVGLKQATVSAFENKPEATKLATFFSILSAVNLELRINQKDPEETIGVDEW